MKVKCIIIGGLVFWIVANLIGFVTGPLIHDGALKSTYQEHESFWRPELNEDPPDMAALMPIWLVHSLIVSLVIAWLYCNCRYGEGPGWKRGMRFGFGLGIFICATYLAWTGIFNLPAKLWTYWAAEALVSYVICSAAMGWAVGKWCQDA